MDPISAIGLTASLVQLMSTVTKTIGYLNDVKNAPKERTQLAQETLSLLGLLISLRDKVETADPTSPWFDRVRTLNQSGGTLQRYKTSLDGLARLVKPEAALKDVGKKLVWPFDKKKIHDALMMIERLKTLISIALQEDNFALSQAIKQDIAELRVLSQTTKHNVTELSEDVKGLSTGIARLSNDQRHQEVLRWLSPLNPESKQIDVLSRRHEGTGRWLLESDEFESWLTGDKRLLWCPGIRTVPPFLSWNSAHQIIAIAGAGKTTLTAIVVDYLRRQFARQEETAILFVYNDYKDQQSQSAANIVGALLQQILLRGGNISKDVMIVYEEHQGGRTQPALDKLCKVLCGEVQKLSRVFLVVDALDEFHADSGDRSPLIALFKNLLKEQSPRLMITSRHNASIERNLPNAVHVEIRASDEDIRQYLESQLIGPASARFRVKLDTTLQQSIIETLANNAKGMFLSVELHLNSLAKKQNRKDLRKALETLPISLNDIYKETFQRIFDQDPDDIQLAKRILSWLSYSRQPMEVAELQHALAVEPDTKEMDWDAIVEESVLVTVCGGLVTVEDDSRVIRLVHCTTQEYIMSVRQEMFPSARLDILIACLTYLQYDALSLEQCEICKDSREPLLKDYACFNPSVQHSDRRTNCQYSGCIGRNELSFQDYACRNWYFYARGDLEQDPKAAPLIIQWLNHRRAALILPRDTDFTVNSEPLHFTAVLGLNTIFRLLLDTGVPNDTLDDDGNSALHYAAYAGQDELVDSALRAGAKINRQNSEGSTPLMLAAGEGHSSTLQLLLNKNARTDIENTSNSRALEYAVLARRNGEDCARLLLDSGATVKNHGITTLHFARNASVVKLLIENGADIDAEFSGMTPLAHTAIYKYEGWEDIVRVFIENGADTTEYRKCIASGYCEDAGLV
ncbi:MAG: hypothetical protein Q9191_003073 [Dirinaria sp. TL-2023a]